MKKLIFSFLFLILTASSMWGGSLVQAQFLTSDDVVGGGSKITSSTDLQDLADDSDSEDAKGFQSLADKVTAYTKQFMIIVGIVIIIYAGIELFLSRGNEEAFKAKIQQTLYLALGFGVMLLAQTVIYELFFGKEGEIFFDGAAGTYEEKARNTFLEMKGVYDYVAMFAIAILLLLVIVTLFQFMLAAETDEAKGRLQRQLIWGSIGVMVLGAVDRFIKIFFGDSGSEKLTEAPDITSAGSETILGEVVGWTNFMLSYVAFGAVLAIIAGGASLIFFLGDDDRIEKGKSMIKYAVVALVICFSAWVAINYFLIPETA